MKTRILDNIAKALNAYLKLDEDSKKRLDKLQDRVVAVELLPIHFIFQLHFTEDGVEIKPGSELSAETIVRGTPMQMMAMVLSPEKRNKFFAEDLEIEGNAELGQQVVQLFDEVNIDWEEQLSKLIGDVPSHHVGKFTQQLRQWLEKTRDNFSKDVGDFLQEEILVLPPKEAVNEFYHDIDDLRMDVDRLAARLKHLEAELSKDEEKET